MFVGQTEREKNAEVRGFQRGLGAAARYLRDELAGGYYSEKIFPPIPDERRAKDAVAAELLRDMLPRFAAAILEIEPNDD